jgi:hypothetical protein
MTALAFVFKLGSIIFFTLAWWCYTPPPALDAHNNKKNETTGPDSTDVSVIQSPSIECATGLANGHTNLTEVLEIM